MSKLEKEVEKLLENDYKDISKNEYISLIKIIIKEENLHITKKANLIYDMLYKAWQDGYDEAIWFYEEEYQ